MKIRLLVDLDDSCLTTAGLQYGIPEYNIYKPVKLQYSYPNEWGNHTEWEDVEVVISEGNK